MSQLQHNTYNNTINITRAIFSRLSGGNITGSLSSALTKYHQLSMTKCSAIMTGINTKTKLKEFCKSQRCIDLVINTTVNGTILDEKQRIIMITKINDLYLISIVPSVF